MPVYARAAVIAVALVVMVGAGLVFLGNRAPGGVGGAPAATPTSSPSPTASPTSSPTAEPSYVAPGITGWTPFTSAVYGYTLSYPQGWSIGQATRAWGPTDGPGTDSTSDMFVNPANDVGYGVSLAPAADFTDVETVEGLKAFAKTYCTDMKLGGCDTFTDRSEPMCLDAGGDPCRAAIRGPRTARPPTTRGSTRSFRIGRALETARPPTTSS